MEQRARDDGARPSPRGAPTQEEVDHALRVLSRAGIIDGHHGVYPWVIGPTVPYKSRLYPPVHAYEPRLGLHESYPYAVNWGLRLPVDADPLPPDPGPQAFEGIVPRLREEMRSTGGGDADGGGEEQTTISVRAVTHDDAPTPGGAAVKAARMVESARRTGGALCRAGSYREAALVHARAFQASHDPSDVWGLVSALVGLGKYEHAEAVLEHAVSSAAALAAAPTDLEDRFPRGEWARLAAKVPADRPLLRAWVTVSISPAEGLEALRELTARGGQNEVATRRSRAAGDLYLHYLPVRTESRGAGPGA